MTPSDERPETDRTGTAAPGANPEPGWDWESVAFDWLREIDPGNLSHRVHIDLLAYFDELKGDGAVPPWSDFDPTRLPHVLPWMIVYDVVGEAPRFRVRLQGTKMVDAWGADITGWFLDELPRWEEVVERFTWLMRERRPYLTKNLRTKMAPNDFQSITALMLPFSTDGAAVDVIVGCVKYER